jgi:hypothetical protein
MERINFIINKIKAIKVDSVIKFMEAENPDADWVEIVSDIMDTKFKNKFEARFIINAIIFDPNYNEKENLFCSLVASQNEYILPRLRELNMQYIFNESINIDWVKDFIKKNNLNINKFNKESFVKLIANLSHSISFTPDELKVILKEIRLTNEIIGREQYN